MTALFTSRGAAAGPSDLELALARAGYPLGSPQVLTTTVLETFDGRLHAADLRLDHTADSLVLAAAGGPAARVAAAGAPRFASDLPPGPMRSRLADIVEMRALLPLATVETTARRAEHRNGDGKVTSVVTIHERVSVDGRALEGWFVTVDALTGYAKRAARARALVDHHTGASHERDAVDTVLDVAGVGRVGRHVDPGIALDPDLPAIEGFRLVLANLDDAIEINRPGTVADLDSEFLHDLRVAVRRSRSILRHGRDVLSPDVLAWIEPGLKLVGDVTGPARDLDVQLLEWDDDVASLDESARRAIEPLRRQLARDQAAAHETLAALLEAGDVTELLRRWHEAVHATMPAGPRGDDRLLAVVRKRVTKAQHRVLEHGRAITPETPADHVHDVRKDAKKLRYLLECFAGLFPSTERKAFVKRLKHLQDLLGEHQDAAVQADELRAAADQLPPTTAASTFLAVGQLIEHLERKRQRARDGFADRFAEYDSPRTRRVLADMLDGAGR